MIWVVFAVALTVADIALLVYLERRWGGDNTNNSNIY